MSCKTGLLLLSAVSLLTSYGCNAPDISKPLAPAKGQAAATVNGTAISENLVSKLMMQGASHGQAPSPDLRKDVIDNLAMQLLLSQEAIKKGLDKSPEAAEQIEFAKQSILAEAFVQDYIRTSPVSEDMMKAEYERIKKQMVGSEYKARHILVEKEAEAKDIIARLSKNPKSFETLAREKSKDPGAKTNGGDLGWFDPRGMVPEFAAAVAKLGKGKLTEQPVKTQFGYHVILLDDSRAKETPSLDKVRPMLQQQLAQQNLQKLLDDMKAKAKIEVVQAATPAAALPKAGKPADTGGK